MSTSDYYKKNPKARKKRLEYQKKYNARPAKKSKRAELARERRKREVMGKGGKDMSHTKSGKMVVGRMLEGADAVQVIGQDPAAPPEVLKRKDLDSIQISSVSQMPQALLHVLNEEELKDLIAYLLSSGDRNAAVFH